MDLKDLPHFVKLEARAFRSAINLAAEIVEKRNTIPILSNVHIELKPPRIEIRATDLDMEIILPVDLIDHSEETFAFTAPAHTLKRMMASLDNPIIRLAMNKDEPTLFVSVEGGVMYEIVTIPQEDFPTLAPIGKKARAEYEQEISFSNGMLKRVCQEIAPYISHEETRYYLNGICFYPREDRVDIVATDGHKSSIAALSWARRASRTKMAGSYP